MRSSLPGGENALLLKVDATNGTTMCTQIPKQLSREELIKVLPDTWVTNYEKLREHVEPLQSSAPTFSKKPDKTVAISFDHSHLKKLNKTTFFFQMYQPTYNHAHQDDPETFAYHLPSIMSEHDWIKQFDNEGHDVWWFKCPFTGHCPWDIQYGCQECLVDEIEWDEHHARRAKSKKKGRNSGREFQTRVETIEKKVEQASSQHAGLTKALELRMTNMQYEICPPGT
ncbi:uncharacterized protein LOC132038062 [Lycium ferocissimum]|uniref:uncharacterized protein LOC132038062 n=1 Tax=Lycium ferocissimum TaxID=112874 RepID=UPI002815A88A|nr:uncharacterized protein LOC132038062 [Lycium ferocissimum]